jgi:hypothetical protein
VSSHNKVRVEDYPLVAELEEVFWHELDRQFMEGEIDTGAMESAYVDPVSGEIHGMPDINKAIIKVLEAYWAEEGR